MNQRTVLVVDDSDSICIAIASYLEANGYGALSAMGGREGIRLAKAHRPDAILLDIMMPEMDGWGVIRELRLAPETASIPVLALTALRLSEQQVREAGFAGYLSKPVPPHRLREEVDRVVRGG